MYACYIHGWSSHYGTCPSCHWPGTTTGGSINFTLDTLVSISQKEHNRLLEIEKDFNELKRILEKCHEST